MSELFHKSEFISSEEKYDSLEEEHDFLSTLQKLRQKKEKGVERYPEESHGHRGRDKDYRKKWKKEKTKIEGFVATPTRGPLKAVKQQKKDGHGSYPGVRLERTDSSNLRSERNRISILDDFLSLLREKGVRVSTPEWLQFITVTENVAGIKKLNELVESNELLNKFRLYAKTVLVKNKDDEAAFHEAFDEYFELVATIFKYEQDRIFTREEDLKKIRGTDFDKDELTESEVHQITEELKKFYEITGEQPIIKEQLGTKVVDENLNSPEGEHKDDEQVHGGKQDQHNDILRKADLAKQGGGDKKEGPKLTQEGFLVGGGKGKSIYAERVGEQGIVHEGDRVSKEKIATRKERVRKVDRRTRYEVRPDKTSMREVIRNIRRIITDVSEIKSGTVDIKRTVGNFARRDFRFDYEKEREKQPEIVLFIDVGGPVDEWSPLVAEVAEAMTEGLTKLEVYLFHNNLYGYVWKQDQKDLLASSYAKPDSLLDVKKIVKHRKKVIIYGDAEMSYSEFVRDSWPPSGNEKRIEQFGMGGEECLSFIKRKAAAVVWINPIFQKEWEERDNSGTIHAAKAIIPMHDLTVGGVEDAIKELMKK
jgi:uncharacterized protein with von Willebrand factor type A (vWA) domain